MKVSRVSEMRAMDRTAIEKYGISAELLMENASHAAYFVLRNEFGVLNKRFLIFCGLGNNGGDGFVLARKIPAEILPEASPTVKISFANDVLPILQSRCIVCHGEGRREQGLDLTSYSTLIAGSENGTIIVAGDADNSLIVELVLAGRMPNRAPKLIPAQVQTLIDWINQGAKDNSTPT